MNIGDPIRTVIVRPTVIPVPERVSPAGYPETVQPEVQPEIPSEKPELVPAKVGE